MEIVPIRTRIINPPQDDLLQAIRDSNLDLSEGDCVAITSKVVSIWEGRCVPVAEHDPDQRTTLARNEATQYVEPEASCDFPRLWTITSGTLIMAAGIDTSNSKGHYTLWPKDPQASAEKLHAWLCEEYAIKRLALIITDSHTTPMRRGVVGFAIAWAGFDPLVDHRTAIDLFGRPFTAEHTNLADALAAGAVLAMGETNECTPLAVIRNAPYLQESIGRKPSSTPSYKTSKKQDLFAPFLTSPAWKSGTKKEQ